MNQPPQELQLEPSVEPRPCPRTREPYAISSRCEAGSSSGGPIRCVGMTEKERHVYEGQD
jgi:hypothetical protein